MPQSCPSCRASVAPSDAFCPTCGAVLHSSSGNHEQETVAYTPSPRTRPQLPHGRSRQQPSRRPRPQPDPDYRQPAPTRQGRPWYAKKRVAVPLVFLVLVLVGGGVLSWLINDRLSTFNTITNPSPDSVPGQVLGMVEGGRGAELGLTAPADLGGSTVLLMGVDARDGESIDMGVRPDSLSVMHISGNTCRTLSIPRDTRTLLPGYGQSKVNHALSVGGIEYQVLVVEQLLGLEIDNFALIDFAGMAGIIDSIGGVTVSTDHELTYEGVTVPAGTSTVNGEQALVFARFRNDAEGDFGRQRRQQELMQALLQQVNAADAVRAVPSVLTDLEGHLKTDLRAGGIASLGTGFLLGCSSGSMENAGLDGSVGSDWDDLEGMQLSFVHVPEGEVTSKVSWLTDGDLALRPGGMALLPNDRREARS